MLMCTENWFHHRPGDALGAEELDASATLLEIVVRVIRRRDDLGLVILRFLGLLKRGHIFSVRGLSGGCIMYLRVPTLYCIRRTVEVPYRYQ